MAYRVSTLPGVAFHEPESCDVHDDCLICVMIGDDYRHHVSVGDVSLLADDGYCPGCGQIGCTAYALVYEAD